MNQSWENNKKTNFQADIGLFGPNLCQQNVFGEFHFY